MALLDQTRTVVESMQNLMVAAKEAGGNRRVSYCHILDARNTSTCSNKTHAVHYEELCICLYSMPVMKC